MSVWKTTPCIALSITSLAAAQEAPPTKNLATARFLNVVSPVGGMGFAYLGAWDSAYGYKMLATQSLLFSAGVTLFVVGQSRPSGDPIDGDVALPKLDNPYSQSGMIFLAGWTATQMWGLYKVGKICNAAWYGFTCRF